MPTPFGSRIHTFCAGCVVAVLAAVLAPSARAQAVFTQPEQTFLGQPLQNFADAANKQADEDAARAVAESIKDANFGRQILNDAII
jgi:hypothetical protein